jgi:sulfur-oxidizing protein SoxY
MHSQKLTPASAALGALCAFAVTSLFIPGHSYAAEKDIWPSLKAEVFGDRAIAEDDGTLTLFTPERAEDAAVVPISVRFPASVVSDIVAMTIVIDRNPAPVAATFKFGDGFRNSPSVGERMFATRIRIDSFSKVRAILETADGKLHMSSRFVIGAGGCSAPSAKDADEALANLGRMQIKTRTNAMLGKRWREARVMIRHPNFTGLQMDPGSGGYVPARFVNDLEVRSEGAVLFRMEGGISISENPHIRFTYGADIDDVIEVTAADTLGTEFKGRSRGRGS